MAVASFRKEKPFCQTGKIESSEKPKATTFQHHTREAKQW
jgi:hypothetical protein